MDIPYSYQTCMVNGVQFLSFGQFIMGILMNYIIAITHSVIYKATFYSIIILNLKGHVMIFDPI